MLPGVYLAQVIIALTARLLAVCGIRPCLGAFAAIVMSTAGLCAARCSARHESGSAGGRRAGGTGCDARTESTPDSDASSRSVVRGARKPGFAYRTLSEDKPGRASCETGMERGTALAQKGDGVRRKQLGTGRSEAAHSLGASGAREAHASDETRPCPQPAASPANPRPRRVPLPASNDLTSD